MGDLSTWKPVDADNNQTPPDGWPEGQAPSTVNNCARADKGAVRRWYVDAEWLDFGFTPTRISGTKFSVTGSSTAIAWYNLGRRVRVNYPTASAAIYGYVEEASESSPTTNITVTLDQSSITAAFTSVDVGIISGTLDGYTGTTLPKNSLPNTGGGGGGGGSPTDAGHFPEGNLLNNSDFQIAQRGTTFTSATTYANNDGAYLFDQWILLSDGNDAVDLSLTTTNDNSSYRTLVIDQETTDKQWAIFQIVPAFNSITLRTQEIIFSAFLAKDSGTATAKNVRIAILEWTGAADSPTKDCIGTWAGGGTNPTLATNWSYIATTTAETLTSTYVTESCTGSVGATANNIGVLVWLDDTTATVGDIVYVSGLKLDTGNTLSAYSSKSLAIEKLQCQEFFQRYLRDTTARAIGTGACISTSNCLLALNWNQAFRFNPSVTASGVDALTVYNSAATGADSSAITFTSPTQRNVQINPARTGSGLTAGNAAYVTLSSAGYLDVSAELGV